MMFIIIIIIIIMYPLSELWAHLFLLTLVGSKMYGADDECIVPEGYAS